ncbi:MAG: hypothetical protein JWM53_4386 [bacterium]|nr:hypothetical protein [bacterium]
MDQDTWKVQVVCASQVEAGDSVEVFVGGRWRAALVETMDRIGLLVAIEGLCVPFAYALSAGVRRTLH